MSISPRWSFLSVSATRACSSSTTGRSPAKHVRPSDTAENTAEPAQQTLKQYIFYLLRYCVFCTPHVRNVGIPPKFYLPGICLGGSQSAVAARFLGVVPYGVGLSSQIEVRKLVLNPEFEKVKGPWLFTSQRPFLVTTEVEETSAVGSNGAKVCGAAEKIAPKLARPFCYNTAYQHPSNLIFYGFRPLVFNQGTVSRQKNQAAFLRPRRFMVPAVALATSKITVLLSG